MRTGFAKADFDALAELWNRNMPDRFRLTPPLLRANTVESPVFDWGASCIELEDDGSPCGFIVIKRCASPRLFAGLDPDQAHVSAVVCGQSMLAVDLMAYVKQTLRNRGVYRLVFGQDSRHFFPGCPLDCHALRDFLIIEGFAAEALVYDLCRDVKDYEPPDGVRLDEAEVRPLMKEDLPALTNLLHKEFPGRWAHDVLDKIAIEGRADWICGSFVNGELIGFAATQDASHRLPIAGAVFHQALGDNWCSLGPIGVAQKARGNGYGDSLLASTLLNLKEKGAQQCVVDWTGLTEWYGKHGFKFWNTYQTFALDLIQPEPDEGFMFPPF
jgi:predicted N-acetyltransferase YhbS